MQDKETENGRSMIEMLGVLAIIGVLSVGGIAGYSKAMYRYRLNKTIEQITYMGGAIRSFFAPQKHYDGLCEGCALLKKAKLVPDDMWESGKNDPQHVWDNITGYNNVLINRVCARYSDNCAGGPRAFKITYQYFPEEACIGLITYDWSNAGVNMIQVYTYMNSEQNLSGKLLSFSTPVSIETAIRACNTADDGPDIVFGVTFYFDVDVNDSNGSSGWKDLIDTTNTLLNGS